MTDYEIQQLSQRVNTISDFLHEKRMENLTSDIPAEGSPEYYEYVLVSQRDKINKLQTQLNKLQEQESRRLNRNEWDFSIGELLTVILSIFGAISAAGLLFRTGWPKWSQILLAIVCFIIWAWSIQYQLDCSKLWEKHGDKT